MKFIVPFLIAALALAASACETWIHFVAKLTICYRLLHNIYNVYKIQRSSFLITFDDISLFKSPLIKRAYINQISEFKLSDGATGVVLIEVNRAIFALTISNNFSLKNISQ